MTITRFSTATLYLTSKCNYSCCFCFTKNLNEKNLSFEEVKELLSNLRSIGIDNVNFAGGEPFLHPELFEYCKYAKEIGMNVSVKTNAYLLNNSHITKMRGIVDQLDIPIDSCSEYIEETLCRGHGDHLTHCIEIADQILEANIRLKVSSVINKLNYTENMRPIIRTINPDVWEVSQLSHIQTMNEKTITDFGISDEQFSYFLNRHKLFRLKNSESPIFVYADNIGKSSLLVTLAGKIGILLNWK